MIDDGPTLAGVVVVALGTPPGGILSCLGSSLLLVGAQTADEGKEDVEGHVRPAAAATAAAVVLSISISSWLWVRLTLLYKLLLLYW